MVSVSVELLGFDSLITRSRNSLVAKFLDQPTATHLMFVDADISYQPAQIFRMAAFDKDVVAGMYPLKTRDWSADAVSRVRGGESLETAPLRYVGLPCEEAVRESEDGFHHRRICRHRLHDDPSPHLLAHDGRLSRAAIRRRP